MRSCCGTAAATRSCGAAPASRWGRYTPMADDSLRIALVAPAAAAVRHDAGGSIEQLVWQLSEGLLDRGHDVTLFATGSSHTRARVSARHARGYDEEDGPWEWQLAECLHAADAFTPEARF